MRKLTGDELWRMFLIHYSACVYASLRTIKPGDGFTLNDLIVFVSLLLLCGAIGVSYTSFRSNSIAVLSPAFLWGIFAILFWIIATISSLSRLHVDAAWQDQAWYWSAILACCPLISVLGAKRPTSRVWNWFIILPLIAVLGWPAVTVLVRYPDLVALKIQAPVYIGFVLVLVMGIGNYMGSRYGLSAFFIGVAVILSLWPMSNSYLGDHDSVTRLRGFASLFCGFAVLHGFRQSIRPSLDESRFDKVWFDFRDAFGIVWSIRIQDRINQTAVKEKWCVRLGTEGFVWEDEAPSDKREHTEERLRHTLYWLLRRFVDPIWIDERLNQQINTLDTSA